MPEMDGFGLLELLGPEIDPPVVLASSDNSPNSVMRGINQGACDYLVKPVRKEELKNLWQHVVRKRMFDIKKQAAKDDEYNSSEDDASDCSATHKKRKYNGKKKSKKARLTWSGPLHELFINAVDVLGVDKAVPKRILQLMNVPGVTRENVGSHLQKYREYLKKLAEKHKVLQQSNITMGSLGFDLSAFSVSGQINVGIPAALNVGLYGQYSGNFEVPAVDQTFPEQASMEGQSSIDVEEGLAFNQPPINFQTNMSTVADDNLYAGVNFQDNNMLGKEGSNPSLMNQQLFQSSSNLQAVNSQGPREQNCDNFSPVMDFSLPSTPSFDLSFGLVEGTEDDLNNFEC